MFAFTAGCWDGAGYLQQNVNVRIYIPVTLLDGLRSIAGNFCLALKSENNRQ